MPGFPFCLSRTKTIYGIPMDRPARKTAESITKFEEFPNRIVHSYVTNQRRL